MAHRRFVSWSTRTTALIACLTLAAACGGEDSTGPSLSAVVGTYSATTFTAAIGGTTHSILADGGAITLALAADGTSTGRVIVPGAGENGADIDETLDGTWTLSGNTITLSDSTSTSDTLLEDLPLQVSGDTLVGDGSFSGIVVHLVLTRMN